MKQFVIKAYDGEGKLDKRMKVRPRHFEGMEKMKEHILCAGGMLDDERVMLGRIVVLPEYRHQGLGTLVVREAEKWAKELGYLVSVLESRDNKIHFYETMGYVADYSQKNVGETFICYRMEKEL